MQTTTLTIINKLGLHARAAAKLVARASRFSSQIVLNKQDKSANGKSIMGVMMLAARKDSIITITAEGDDELDAITDLTDLINNRFGEAE